VINRPVSDTYEQWSARIFHKLLPLIQGVIARRMLLNFRADADVVQRLLLRLCKLTNGMDTPSWVFV
jgi:hypothetical protein